MINELKLFRNFIFMKKYIYYIIIIFFVILIFVFRNYLYISTYNYLIDNCLSKITEGIKLNKIENLDSYFNNNSKLIIKDKTFYYRTIRSNFKEIKQDSRNLIINIFRSNESIWTRNQKEINVYTFLYTNLWTIDLHIIFSEWPFLNLTISKIIVNKDTYDDKWDKIQNQIMYKLFIDDKVKIDSYEIN